jgi:hypothetical protein
MRDRPCFGLNVPIVLMQMQMRSGANANHRRKRTRYGHGSTLLIGSRSILSQFRSQCLPCLPLVLVLSPERESDLRSILSGLHAGDVNSNVDRMRRGREGEREERNDADNLT